MDYKLDIIGLARVDDEQTAEALARLCHEKLGAGVGSPSRPRFSQAAAVACRYCPIASARTEGSAADEVALEVERVVDGSVDGQ